MLQKALINSGLYCFAVKKINFLDRKFHFIFAENFKNNKTMRMKFVLIIGILLAICNNASAHRDVVIVHSGGSNQGLNQIYIENPRVTYDDALNELYVYFGSTGTIDLEYIDTLGTPCYFVYGESHVGYTSTIYTGLPAGYYTITIHSIYGYTYTGNFSVS